MQTAGRVRFQRKRLICVRRRRNITAKTRGRLDSSRPQLMDDSVRRQRVPEILRIIVNMHSIFNAVFGSRDTDPGIRSNTLFLLYRELDNSCRDRVMLLNGESMIRHTEGTFGSKPYHHKELAPHGRLAILSPGP